MRRRTTRLRAVGLVALASVLAACQPCDDPRQFGPIGFIERPGQLGVVLVDGVAEPYLRIRDGERDGVGVVWTTDARTFSPPEPMTTAGFDGLEQSQHVCDAAGRCVQARGGGEPSLSLSNRDEWFPTPVPEHRRQVLARVDECHEVNGAMGAAVLPATGELVVAYGQDGLAVLEEDGWDWRGVDGWERRALVLTEVGSIDDPLVGDLLTDLWFPALGATLMTLVLLLLALRSRRRLSTGMTVVLLVGAPVAVYVVGMPIAVIATLFGVPFTLSATLVGTGVAGAGAVLAGALLPRPVRRDHVFHTVVGAVVGGLAVLAWYFGAPIPWEEAMVSSVVAAAGGGALTARLRRDRGRPSVSSAPTAEPAARDEQTL